MLSLSLAPFTIEMVLYFGAIGLILIGLIGLLILQNVFRMLLSLVIFESGANLFLVLSGYLEQGIAPIVLSTSPIANSVMNDPVPQALVLTAIVIGVGIQALALALIFKLKDHYGTLDMREIRCCVEQDIAKNAGVCVPASLDHPNAYQAQSHNQKGASNE
ncbi:MAG: sodium:proton antiporter [Pseudomonadota bacterium]